MVKFISSFMQFFSLDKDVRFARRLIKNFGFKSSRNLSKFIFVESFQTPSNRLGLTFFVPIVSRFFEASPVCYYMMPYTKFRYIKEKLRFVFSIERAIGCTKFHFIPSGKDLKNEAAKNLIDGIKNLREFEVLKYKNIVIGDLIYDVYLRRHRVPTLNLKDDRLVHDLSEFLEYFDYWETLFERKKVAAVCVSHTVYTLGLPARMAIFYGVPAFQITAENVYRMTSEETHAYTAFKKYPEIFKTLDLVTRSSGLKLAKERLRLRFSGGVGIDMHYSTKSAYTEILANQSLLDKDQKFKILIAVHDFYDSPHSYGNNLYPDFLEWLNDLAKIAEQTDYRWYIKTHPDIQGDGNTVLAEFIRVNPKFKIIPSYASHHQLIDEGISLALTIFGTIAMEYPYLGVPVINASINNPHTSYNFSITPKTIDEYHDLLLNPSSITAPFDKQEILEYYFMHHIYMLKSWTFMDYDLYFKTIGGFPKAFSWSIFREFANSQNAYPIQVIQNALINFLHFSDNFLYRKHFNFDNLK